MSVINRMLRDLDARAASEKERAGLPGHLRTLPAAPRRSSNGWLLLLAGAALGGVLAGGLLWSPSKEATVGQPAVAPAPTIAPAALARPPASDPSALPLAAVLIPLDAPAPLPLPTPAPAALPEPDIDSMKLSLQISRVPASVVDPPVAAPVRLAPAVDRQAAGNPAAAPPTAPLAAVAAQPVATVAPQIDKRGKTDTAGEQAEAAYRLAMQAVQRGDTATALPHFQRALQLEPTLAHARQGYLAVLVAARRWEVAQQVAAAGLALDPTHTGWATLSARLQVEHDAPADAAATLARYAAHAAQDADFQALYAVVLHKLQRPAEAVERYRAALQLRGGEWRWWFGLGLALEAVGDAPAARAAFAQAQGSGQLPEAMAPIVAEKLK